MSMAKCPKCENDKFVGEKVTSPYKMVIIKCKNCDTAISTMEDIDIASWKRDMFKNHGFFEQQFNIMKRELEDLKSKQKKDDQYIIELLEGLHHKLKNL